MKHILRTLSQKVGNELFLPLLLFLLVFTIDKIVLKFAGLILLYLLHPDFHFRKNLRKIPLFYLLLLAVEIVKFLLLNTDFSTGHTVTFLLGCLFWIMSFLSLHQVRSIVDTIDQKRIDRTLTVFFLVNAAISIVNLLLAVYRSGTLNPYASGDSHFGTSTGDLIKGLFQGPSYLNMMISSFFLFYYLYKGRLRLSFLALVIALLTTCNFGNLIMLPVLLAALIFTGDRTRRVSIAGYLVTFVVFYLAVTPSNLRYIKNSLFVPKKQQQELIAYEKKAILMDEMKANVKNRRLIDSMEQKGHVYTAANVDAMLARTTSVADSQIALTGKSGKLQSFKETGHYLVSGPKPFLVGAGMGCFSSFLALRMSDADKEDGSRLFTYLPSYEAPAFQANHYKIFRAIYELPTEFHSAKHFPNSFLNQIFGEYGVIGALLFLLGYVYFFVKRFRQLSYGRYLLFLLGGYLLVDYLFEYLSVVTVFELLMFCDIRRGETTMDANTPSQAEPL